MNQQECSKQFMTAAGLLPERLWRAAFTVPPDEREKIEEFRLRIGRPFCAVGAGKRYTLADAVTRGELDELLQRATRCRYIPTWSKSARASSPYRRGIDWDFAAKQQNKMAKSPICGLSLRAICALHVR